MNAVHDFLVDRLFPKSIADLDATRFADTFEEALAELDVSAIWEYRREAVFRRSEDAVSAVGSAVDHLNVLRAEPLPQ